MNDKDQLGPLLSWLGLGLLIGYSAVAVIYFGQGLSFINDEYSLMSLVGQASFREMLNPYVGHLTVLSQLIYKGILTTFSNQSYLPFQIGVIISKSFLAAASFIYIKKRSNDIFALMISAVILFISVD